jgi:hypothetical protein
MTDDIFMEKERLCFNINRFDHYYDSVNNKIAGYVALNTFLLGGFITLFVELQDKSYFNCIKYIILFEVLLTLISSIIAIMGSIPYFSKASNSLYYFYDISQLSERKFMELSEALSEDEELEDLRRQVFVLSKGLNKKFKRLRSASFILMIQFILLFPLLLIMLF